MNISRKVLCRSSIWRDETIFLLQALSSDVKKFSSGGFGRLLDRLPTRETWFCFYQPKLRQTAYLYEYDIPINNAIYIQQVAPEISQHFSRPARDSYIHAVHGESFSNCDVAHPPWYCYHAQLSGVRVGQRLGPYAADDVVSPNRLTLPQQQRWRNNVRDVNDIVEFLSLPTEARLNAHLRHLVAAAHQDHWRKPVLAVHTLMSQHWGHTVLEAYGFGPEAVRKAYDLYRQRLVPAQAATKEGRVIGHLPDDANDAAERRAAARRLRRQLSSGAAGPSQLLEEPVDVE